MTSDSLGGDGPFAAFHFRASSRLWQRHLQKFLSWWAQASSNTVGDLLVSNLLTWRASLAGEQFCSSPTVGLD